MERETSEGEGMIELIAVATVNALMTVAFSLARCN
jgi:hypothetical protein